MNRDHEGIEDLLRRMPLRQAPASLDQRVAELARVDQPPRSSKPMVRPHWRGWGLSAGLSGAAAAAVLTAAVLWPTPPDADPGVVVSPPIQSAPLVDLSPAQHHTVHTQLTDQGVIFLDKHTPVRRIHRRDLQRVMWTDPKRAVCYETTMPHEETWLVPVTYD